MDFKPIIPNFTHLWHNLYLWLYSRRSCFTIHNFTKINGGVASPWYVKVAFFFMFLTCETLDFIANNLLFYCCLEKVGHIVVQGKYWDRGWSPREILTFMKFSIIHFIFWRNEIHLFHRQRTYKAIGTRKNQGTKGELS